MTNRKSRFQYIDIMKGILILLVVYGHTAWQAHEVGIHNQTIEILGQISFFYEPFYMAAFFAITGYCSNFKKSYKDFLISDIKTLLFPSVSLCVVAAFIRYLIMGEIDLSWITPHRLLRFCSLHWFLPALFWAKQIHFFLHRFNQYVVSIIYIFLAFVGFYLVGHTTEYWWFYHALMFVIYLQFGSLIKSIPIPSKSIYVILYLVVVIALLTITGNVPKVTSETNMQGWQMPIFILTSCIGTLGMFWISQKIHTCKFLEYFGRNSIVIYCVHFTLMNDFYRLFADSINTMNVYQSVFTLILMYSMILTICTCVCWMLNFKYTRWIVGKF